MVPSLTAISLYHGIRYSRCYCITNSNWVIYLEAFIRGGSYYKIIVIDGNSVDVSRSTFSVIQLVASADCAGALDVTDDLQHLLVCPCTIFQTFISSKYFLTVC